MNNDIEESKRVVEISKSLEELIKAKETLRDESVRAYLGLYYIPEWYSRDICVMKFPNERLKIMEQWIDEDLEKLQKELKSIIS